MELRAIPAGNNVKLFITANAESPQARALLRLLQEEYDVDPEHIAHPRRDVHVVYVNTRLQPAAFVGRLREMLRTYEPSPKHGS
jgi:hypothetical protein